MKNVITVICVWIVCCAFFYQSNLCYYKELDFKTLQGKFPIEKFFLSNSSHYFEVQSKDGELSKIIQHHKRFGTKELRIHKLDSILYFFSGQTFDKFDGHYHITAELFYNNQRFSVLAISKKKKCALAQLIIKTVSIMTNDSETPSAKIHSEFVLDDEGLYLKEIKLNEIFLKNQSCLISKTFMNRYKSGYISHDSVFRKENQVFKFISEKKDTLKDREEFWWETYFEALKD